MSQNKIDILQRALNREKAARRQAEKILEDKSKELYITSEELKESNKKLETLITERDSELKGVFENLVDAYMLIDLKGNVIKMNESAIELFGFNTGNEKVNVIDLIYKEDFNYAMSSFNELLINGSFTNYKAHVYTKQKGVRLVHINSSVIYNKENQPIGAQGIVRDITEETAIKELIEEQKEELNIIFNNSPIGISLSKENDNGLLLVNNSMCKMLGYSAEEFKRMQVQDFVHIDDREISKINRGKLFRGEIDNFSLEKRYIKKNGEILWAKTSVSAVRDSYGKLKFQVSIIEDITQERLVSKRLKESEDRLTTLIHNLDSGIFLEDENLIGVLANKKVCELFNLPIPPEQLKGQDFSNIDEFKKLFINPKEFAIRYHKIIKNKEIVIGDELKMTDGKILERNYIPIFKDTIFKGHLWSFNDVTLRRKYRKSLEAQKQKYSNIIANMNLGLVELNTKDEILMVNQSFTEMSGYTQDELIGKNGIAIFPIDENTSIIEEEAKKRLKGESNLYEIIAKMKNGEKRNWLISEAPNYNMKGKLTGSIGIYLDITNLKKLEDQKENLLKKLERSNDELQEYAHIVSHDLKSPLRSIYALVNWIKEDNHGKLDINSLKNISLIEMTLEKMEHLISDILDYSSATSKNRIEEPVDLNCVIKDIRQLVHLPNHISLKILNKLPVIQGDKIRFQQLFQNLISNAIRYIDKEIGIIEIDVKEQVSSFQFSIKDNGIGIKKEYHNKIFKIFHTLNSDKESSGIGLSTVKKIVEMYEGEIWLESEPGTGTTFFIKLRK